MTLPQAFGKDSPDRCIDMQERYIRRKDSASLYGIAIIMMVFHHLFCIPSRLGYHYIPVTGSFETEARIAWLGKMCVGIFAFVTGYAHAITAARDTREDHITNRFIGDVQNSLRWLVKFYSKFWLVFAIYVTIGVLFFNASTRPSDLILGLLIGRGGYNGEWWYVSQHLCFLLFFPILDCALVCLAKRNMRWFIILTAIGALCAVFLVKLYLGETLVGRAVNAMFSYMVIYTSAFAIGKYGVFEKLRIRNHIILVLLLVFVFAARWFYAKRADEHECDVILIPILVYALVGLLHIPRVESIAEKSLGRLGKYSTFIWLSHTFWIYYYFQPVILLPRYSTLIFIWSFVIVLLNAMILDGIYGRLSGWRKEKSKRAS